MGAWMPADTSPMRRRVSGTVSADSPKAINLRPASASSGNSKGVSAPSLRSLASVCSAFAASPIRVENATFVCSKSAAELTAFTPTPIAAAPPANAAPMPALSAMAVTCESFAECRRPALAESRQSRAGHFPHAAGGCGDKFGGSRHGPLQGGDVGSKGDGQGAHAPGVESTICRTSKSTHRH